MCNVDEYFEKPFWVIDILPKQVPDYQQPESKKTHLAERGVKKGKGQYFTIEEYFLDHPRIDAIHGKFTNILLKLNCYEDFDVSIDGEEWMKNPAPKVFEKMMSACMTDNGMIYIFMKSEETLITVCGDDDTYMTIYHPSEEALKLLSALALSEGLFIWQPVR